jgi:ParB-like chromosome segregation protein Spo0J
MLKVVYKNISELRPHPKNARVHSSDQVAQIAASIQTFGFTHPIVTDGNLILAGHGRVAAAKSLKMETVPAVDVAGWDPIKQRAFVIADNKIASNSTWDIDKLADEIAALSDSNFNIDTLGFSDNEISDLLAGIGDLLGDLPDATPTAVKAHTRTKKAKEEIAPRVLPGDVVSLHGLDFVATGPESILDFLQLIQGREVPSGIALAIVAAYENTTGQRASVAGENQTA